MAHMWLNIHAKTKNTTPSLMSKNSSLFSGHYNHYNDQGNNECHKQLKNVCRLFQISKDSQ